MLVFMRAVSMLAMIVGVAGFACRIGVQALAIRVAGRTGFSRGDVTRLSWARGAQHFFEAVTGKRSEDQSSHQDATMFA